MKEKLKQILIKVKNGTWTIEHGADSIMDLIEKKSDEDRRWDNFKPGDMK